MHYSIHVSKSPRKVLSSSADLALEISIPKLGNRLAREDCQEEDDRCVDGDVPEHDPSGDLEAPCGKHVEVEHDQG